MKVSKSAKYSAFFFLIFLLGIIFFVAYINKTLNKRTEIFPKDQKINAVETVIAFKE